MFHELFRWLQEDVGANPDLGVPSWSEQFLGSLNLWPILEGTHVIALMLFAGTIWIVDLRMMGIAFRNVPFSKINDRILPLTVAGLAILIVTGVILFLAKPMVYYHSVWFRFKLVVLFLAAANIIWFHYSVQKNADEWDANPNPPAKVKLSAVVSMLSWILVIAFGRLIAYAWLDCGKPLPGWVNTVAECSTWPTGVITANPAGGLAPAPEGVSATGQTTGQE